MVENRNGINTAVFDLAYLLGCEVNGVKPDAEQVAMMDLDAVYQEAGRHMLDAAAAMALESAGVRDECSSMRIARSMRKTALFDREKKAVLEKMEENGIWYMPFKGALVKQLYPKYGMREFSDYDILFDSTRRNDLRELMLGLGFSGERVEGGVHDHYFKTPVLNFEMHKILFSLAFDRRIVGYYENVKERLVKDPDNQFGWHFTSEDFYVYILAHAYKHYSNGGTGLRSLLDIYVILKEISPDKKKVSAELEKLGITDFESLFRSLSLDLFSGKELTEDELEMLAYMVSSGTYGTVQNIVSNKISKAGGGKSGKRRYIFNRFFPTMEQIEYGNPFFYKHKILLPFLMPYRLLRGVLKRRAHLIAELKALKKF
ncbi:MAG: nucleotidyltransferase family protein [Anaerolineaceae bacterium]|nr:nucleotidyltransferase family protein [Anaerolineaceae bacterium]